MNIKSKAFSVFLLILIVFSLFGIFPASGTLIDSDCDDETKITSNTSENSEIPDFFDLTSIKNSGMIHRVPEEESMSSIVIDNNDGTHTLYQYPADIKFINNNGDVVDKSVKFKSIKDGFIPVASDLDVLFPNFLNEGVKYTYKNYSFTFIPEEKNVNAELSKDNKNISYRVNSYLSYEYSLSFDGIKEIIVLNKYTGINKFSYLIKSDTLTPQTDGRELYLYDKESKEAVICLGDLFVSDSAEKNNIFGEIQVEDIGSNEYRITNIIPTDYLTSEDRVYPVYIDPTITVTGASNIEDVTIGSIGGMESMTSGSLYAGLGNTDGKLRFLMKFSSLSSNSTYLSLSANEIVSATINLKDLMCYTDKHIYLGLYSYASGYLPTSTWTNGCMSWSSVFQSDNRLTQIGSYKDVYYGNGDGENGQQWYAFNATNLVKFWKNGTVENYVAVFKSKSETENGSLGNYLVFASSNRNSNNPYIKIDYLPSTSMTLDRTTMEIELNGTETLRILNLPSNSTAAFVSDGSNNLTLTNKGNGVCEVRGNTLCNSFVTVYVTKSDNYRLFSMSSSCSKPIYI